MAKNLIVTIAREYGSGGRLVGEKLASVLGVSFYDKKLIDLAAQQSGLAADIIRANEDVRANPFSYAGIADGRDLPLSEQVFIMESDIIKKIAESESAVIVGRCGDWLLRDSPNCVRAFVHAPFKWRVAFAAAHYSEHSNTEAYVKKIDRSRKAYYNYYTQQEWGECANYHLSLDSSIGVDAAAAILKSYIDIYRRQQ
jgi:cytidylate kinase